MKKNRKDEIDSVTENIIEKNMVEIMSDRFGRYSKYVIQQRAIPDSRDGLKPVQRRILYSMWNLKLKNKEPFKKSARIVGDVIGRYHPHGDSSIYEALVRMCQEWKSNYPLIEMHGNKGSIDDDPAAAMRYTESRLEKIAELMLKDLDRKVVSMAPNFDDSEYEPTVLPALFPNLLVNGAKGIASGFATEIPPHNLKEVIDATIAMIKKPNISIEELMQYVKGPDFPTGGLINGVDGIIDAMKTGQGKISLSAKYRYVYDEKNEEKINGIEIIEIPFGVIKSKLVADIDAIAIDKIINGIKDVRDQSDRNGISIYIELEDSANPEAIIAYLMKKTDLRITYNYNMVAIDKNAPVVLNLDTALRAYLGHLKEVNINGIKYDLQKYKLRLEIVEGFIRVAEISDEVIKVIKDSDNSKKGVILALMNIFNFTEIQATAIAELRLYKLSRMDQIQFQNEKLELEESIAFCTKLLTDNYEFDKYLIKQIKAIKDEYGIERKTEISEEKIQTEIDHKLLTKNEDFYFFISKEGYIKKISLKMYNTNELSTYKLKEGDALQYYDKINSLSKLIFFTNTGNYFIVDAHTLKDSQWKDLGNHVSSIAALDSNEHIIRVMEITSFNTYVDIILMSKYGYAKKVKLEEFNSKLIAKKRNCMSFKNNDDELIDARISNGEKDMLILLNNGFYHLINESVFSTTLALRAQGIKLLGKLQTKDNVFVSTFATVSKINHVIMISKGGMAKSWNMKEMEYVGRYNRGAKLFVALKNDISEPISLEVLTDSLEFIYTNQDNNLEKFDLEPILKDRSKSDKLIKLNYTFNNPGNLIQHIKINELKDPSLAEQEKIREEYLSKQNKDDLSLTVETSLLKRYYHNEIHQEETENGEEQKDELEQVTLFNDEDFSITKSVNIQKKEPAQKRSLEEKLAEIENIDVDALMKKVKQFKKK
ncbi:DNA topoisomerase (ATP-hydrolyzing) [Metamycoplasma neophronis]|uniref:DNA topoisomerase (ATP-hydrolyzing) n=1 Tax=Metamycoplasma neophronis TaxID=872983 RepID=A0ABY2Z4H7_9BACT|nr:DNA topoisomerase (ATP-hydrolyzing) [Metamycoplasma neophronis]TPR54306.1 DNA topoisomerase 4 subunit A [Metamycoplasma neophronis]